MNSAWYAWRGVHAADDKSTAEKEMCYAAWYVNDINFQVAGGVAASHEQLFFMHNANPPAGCGSQGMNHWDNIPIDSAAACLGCPYYMERCPSPPPTSPPPPTPPAPGVPTSVQEPTSALVVIGTVVGGLLGSLLFALFLVCVCATPLAAAANKIDCDDRPDPYKNPKAFQEWRRQCEEENTAARVSLLKL